MAIHIDLSPAAKEIIDNNEIFVPTEVLAEVVYVLIGAYGSTREDVSKALTTFINSTGCMLVNHDVIEHALDLFQMFIGPSPVDPDSPWVSGGS